LTSGATFLELKLFIIRDLVVPIPPLSLQQSFAAKIESIEKQKATITKSIEESQKLFDYTMDKYFG
jgi:type I restriction enzyme S subunit